MAVIDDLQDALQNEKVLQISYNKYLLDIQNPEVRQFFTQLRDKKMQNITLLQQQIVTLMQQGSAH